MMFGSAIYGLCVTMAATGSFAPQQLPRGAVTLSEKPLVVSRARKTAEGVAAVAERPQSLWEMAVVPGGPKQHPLAPVLRRAREELARVEKIRDYSATVVKREMMDGRLSGVEQIAIKVRREPLSIYMRWEAPAELKGQEAIYVAGRDGGKMTVHGVGVKKKAFGTVLVKPDGPIAMSGRRHPLTEIGIESQLKRMIEMAQADLHYGECEVRLIEHERLGNRLCTIVQVVHPTARRNFVFHITRMFVDESLEIPIRFEAYDWPKRPKGGPELVEECSFLDLQLNRGLGDKDFDPKNSDYEFP